MPASRNFAVNNAQTRLFAGDSRTSFCYCSGVKKGGANGSKPRPSTSVSQKDLRGTCGSIVPHSGAQANVVQYERPPSTFGRKQKHQMRVTHSAWASTSAGQPPERSEASDPSSWRGCQYTGRK